MKKIIIIIILSLCCFGCKAKYQLTINEDLSVLEEIVGLESDSFYENYPKSTKSRVIDFIIETKKDYLNEVGYSKKNIIEDELTGAKVNKKFTTLEEYFEKSKAYTQFYDSWVHKIENGIVTIDLQNQLLRNENSIERYLIDECDVIITLPFKVIRSNADSIDKKTNTYTWNLNDQTQKKIYLKFDSQQFYVYKESKYTKYGIIIAFVILIIIISYLIYKKNKKNNKI